MQHGFIGIDVGSTNVKIYCRGNGAGDRSAVAAHEGDLRGALTRLFADIDVACYPNGHRALATGTAGRHRLKLPEVIAPLAIEAGIRALCLTPRAVVSMGGEDMVVYVLDGHGKIVTSYSGNKCAAGSGEFFRQQLGRMGMTLDDLDAQATGARVLRLSSRCSVFMKSDCTHKLNKGEATKGDIALSMSKVMADKVGEFLTKARIAEGEVLLVGGMTQNRFLVDFIRAAWPALTFVVPKVAPMFEAFGAAHLAAEQGDTLPEEQDLVHSAESLSYGRFDKLSCANEWVEYLPSVRAAFDPQAEYILGVDGGSTTTKVALVNAQTLEVVAAHYGRTHGDPVVAFKQCVVEVQKQLAGARPKIVLVATTGSSRELLGVFLETAGVYNEIIAHTVGTLHFSPKVDTIFEIGGQDAKYVSINNGVPIDYAMNEACSAGTGSFLEESASGDLSIGSAIDIGPIALEAPSPLKFGEHCSAFINSDIRKSIQMGAGRPDITAGIVFSIVSNYLNRVVGTRAIGEHIALQGGVAKNPAVPLAFAQITQRHIVVPPDPELMGAFGVARLAKKKCDEGLLERGEFDLDAVLQKEILYKNAFVCRACDNDCTIRNLEVDGHKYPFGGRCSKYTNLRKKQSGRDANAVDYAAVRSGLLFEDHAPSADTFVARTDKVVGIPMTFSTHSLWPLYAGYFHELGVPTKTSQGIAPAGLAKLESNYCFPAEIAHGTAQDVLDRGVDYIFLPHFRDMPTHEKAGVHACTCPLTQGLPYMLRRAFGLPDDKILKPLVAFKHGLAETRGEMAEVACQLGFERAQGERAFDSSLAAYERFLETYQARGRELLAEVRANPDKPYVLLCGRPYNAFTRDANMGIPRKFTSQGVTVIPFDMVYSPDEPITPNMYWYYGQQNMKAVTLAKETPNLYVTWISNFSCAPDSFMLHYLREAMGQKPYLVLEIDSHSADAGVDTRIEAFLDIVDSYRRVTLAAPPARVRARFEIVPKKEFCDIVDRRSGERIDIRDPRVTMIFPPMGDIGVAAVTRAAQRQGVHAMHLPRATEETTQLARNLASGKECIPALIVLGTILEYFRHRPPNREGEVFVLMVPTTMGPCRTGQYHVWYEQVFARLGWQNVVQLISSSESSYSEMGPKFTQDVWRALVLSDAFVDIQIGLRLLAKDPELALAELEVVWDKVLDGLHAGPAALDGALEDAAARLLAIPRRRRLADLKKVLIVGEIYVRRDTFSVTEIVDFLVSRDIFPKVTGVTEWFSYTDYSRKVLMEDRRQREGLLRVLTDGKYVREKAVFHIEAVWKHWVEDKLLRHLRPLGLFPQPPHDMEEIISEGATCFFEPKLESEATSSSAVAGAAMREGWDGVAIIAPFGCLPGRLIEGVYGPWAKARGYPVIGLENDGRPYPPNTVSRLDVFAHNVSRYAASATPARDIDALPAAG
ncbi:MAG: BadF/BadG/BcrA/BcrD ATPase family protein [Myxococcota bacterium]